MAAVTAPLQPEYRGRETWYFLFCYTGSLAIIIHYEEEAPAIKLRLKASGKIRSNWDVALAVTQSASHQCPACFRKSADAARDWLVGSRVRQSVHFWVALAKKYEQTQKLNLFSNLDQCFDWICVALYRRKRWCPWRLRRTRCWQCMWQSGSVGGPLWSAERPCLSCRCSFPTRGKQASKSAAEKNSLPPHVCINTSAVRRL